MKSAVCRAARMFVIAFSLAVSGDAHARIELFLMGQTVGLKPPPLDGEIWFKGTPFGHMALYIESATLDDGKIIRQCGEGERGGLVLTVDRQLKDRFFVAGSRSEFFYGGLDPDNLPSRVTREEIASDLARFNQRYGRLYRAGPNASGLGQDYGVLYIRDVRGLVYPTTKEEEARIIEYWQEHRHDSFTRMSNNCVTTVIGSLKHAGLERRSFFIRGLAPYNTWTYFVKKFLWAGPESTAPNGNYFLRDGAGLTYYPQIPSEAVYPTGRPFNVYCLKNLGYVMWLGPSASPPPSGETISYRDYPTGREVAQGVPRRGGMEAYLWWYATQSEEFLRLWVQSFKGIWFLIAG